MLVFASLFLLCASWAVATPVAGGPDESGHIIKAAGTVRGDFTGTTTSTPGVGYFVLPADVGGFAGAVTCFGGNPNQKPVCAPGLGSLGDASIAARTGAAGYNPAYYALVGWPAAFLDGGKMVMAMRFLNAAIVAALWTVVLVVLAFRRPRPVLFVSLAMTPLAVYLGGVVNPSGVEIAATAAVVVLLDAVASGRGRRTVWLPIALGVSLALLISLRSISPLFAALAVLAVLAIRGWRPLWAGLRRRAMLVMMLALVPVGFFAVVWTLLVAQPAGFIPSSDPRRPGRIEAFWHMLEVFPGQFTEMVGVMGWFDAWPPIAVHIVWACLVAGVVLLAMLVSRPRHAAAVLALAALLFFLPAVLQAASASEFGYIWQGRYNLPLLAILLVVAAIAVEESNASMAPVRFTAFSIALLGMHVWAFVAVLKRYGVGADASWSLWSTDTAWQPPGGAPLVITAFAAGVLLFSLALVVNTLSPRRTRSSSVSAESGRRARRDYSAVTS